MKLDQLCGNNRGDIEAVIRGLCSVNYLGNFTALCRVLGRYKMFVDTQDRGLAPHLMMDGFWEMWVTQVIASLLRPGMIVADIGANLGYFTVLMAEKVGASGQVYAFEPNPRMAYLLEQTLLLNGMGQVELNSVALGEQDGGEVMLVMPPGEPKNGNILPFNGHVHEHSILVPAARLDSRPDWRNIEFAKIDVEGAEELVWAGMQGMFSNGRLRTVILEFMPGRYEDATGFLEALAAPGFSFERIDPKFGIVPVHTSEILAGNANEDVMLLLRR